MTAVKNSRYEKQYTDNDIRAVLSKNPNGLMLGKIQSEIGCSEMTVRSLLRPMIESGQVIKTNIGQSEKKPVNLYTLRLE